MAMYLNKLRKMICLALVIMLVGALFVISPISTYAQTQLPEYLDGFELIASEGDLELYFDNTSALSAVYDKKSGEFWCGFAKNIFEDETIAKGATRDKMIATLAITYTDTNSTATASEVISHKIKDVTLKDENGKDVKDEDGKKIITGLEYSAVDFKTEKVDNGIEVTFTFSNLGFSVPVIYELKDSGLNVSIDTKKIVEKKSNLVINTISLLPYMGSGSTKEEGYCLIPDGSGAVINFNNNKQLAKEYKQYVYGRDNALTRSLKTFNVESANLNVFGVNKGDKGMTAIITSGASRAILSAFVSGQKNSYNGVYSSFIFRDSDIVSIMTKSYSATNFTVYEASPANTANYTVRYIFSSGKEDSSYIGMAKTYREYLEKNANFEKNVSANDYPLFLGLFGAYKTSANFLGISYMRLQVNTAYKEAQTILNEMKDSGVDSIIANYIAWGKGGLESSVNAGAKTDWGMGSKKEFNALVKYAKDNNIALSFDTNLSDIYESNLFNYNKSTYAAQGINKSYTKAFYYNPITGEGIKGHFVMSPNKLNQVVDKYLKNYSKIDTNSIALTSLTDKVYSDFSKEDKFINRVKAEEIFKSVYEKMSNAAPVYASNPIALALSYSDYVADIPTMSSKYDITNYDVPFYAAVLHGHVKFSLVDTNKCYTTSYMLLKTLESGASLKFTYSYKDTAQIYQIQAIESVYDYYYTDYKSWKDESIELYKEIAPILKQVSDKTIVYHYVPRDNTAVTVYDGGLTILLNYNDFDVEIEGNVVKANTYFVTGGNE